jgi:folate-binding protein YgfZ
MASHPLDDALQSAGAAFDDVRGLRVATDFGDIRAEYDAALTGAALYDARERGLIELTGKDRAPWLHNLVTSAVKTLQPNEGNYAFATDVKGRILFDLNVLVLDDRIWLDVDRRLIEKAMTHMDRYLIMEDAKLSDRSDAFARIALLGPKAPDIVAQLGASHAPSMASLGSTTVTLLDKPRRLVRHDFAGVFGAELYIEAEDAPACWKQLLQFGQSVGLRPVGRTAVHVLRVEAGIPAYGEDIDDTVLPAETQQIERAISYVKGCYLGQEVVERMRSHGALARKLVGLRFDGDPNVQSGAKLLINGTDAGRITSVCRSYAVDATIGLGYLKTAHGNPGTRVNVAAEPPTEAEIVALPFRGTGAS